MQKRSHISSTNKISHTAEVAELSERYEEFKSSLRNFHYRIADFKAATYFSVKDNHILHVYSGL